MENVRNLNRGNPKGTDTDLEVLAATFRCMGYLVVYELLNARHFRCSQNRERYYIVCFRVSDSEVVKGAEAEHPWLDEFSTLLRSFTSFEPFSIDQFLLADDDPDVLAHIEARKAQAKATAAAKKDAKSGKEFLVRHLEAYQNAGLRWPPDPAEGEDLYAALRHLSRREMECAWYHTLVAEANAIPHAIVDLNMSIDWAKGSSPDKVHCIVSTSKLYSTRRRRDLCGLEVLNLQGMWHQGVRRSPRKFTTTELVDLAGNAFNGFVCIALLAALFGAVKWDLWPHLNCYDADDGLCAGQEVEDEQEEPEELEEPSADGGTSRSSAETGSDLDL